jgi:hypothetical protein
MTNPTPPLRPALTHQELLDLHGEILRACDELIEMIEVNGPVSAMWSEPRRYFAPEPNTGLPFPGDDLADAVWRVLLDPDGSTDPDNVGSASWLNREIILHWQFFELARREIIPERFRC